MRIFRYGQTDWLTDWLTDGAEYIEPVGGSKNVTVIVDDDEIRNYSVANSMIGHNVNTNDSGDVTILPEALKSFPYCLHLEAARSERLTISHNTAIWRSIKLSATWICVILFVLWLSSIFFSSTVPKNPFKFFFIFYLYFFWASSGQNQYKKSVGNRFLKFPFSFDFFGWIVSKNRWNRKISPELAKKSEKNENFKNLFPNVTVP